MSASNPHRLSGSLAAAALLAVATSCAALGDVVGDFSPDEEPAPTPAPAGWKPVALDVRVALEPSFCAALGEADPERVRRRVNAIARAQARLAGRFATSASDAAEAAPDTARALLDVRLQALELRRAGASIERSAQVFGYDGDRLCCSVSVEWIDRHGLVANELVASACGDDSVLMGAVLTAGEDALTLKSGTASTPIAFRELDRALEGALARALDDCVADIDRHGFGARTDGAAGEEPELVAASRP